jgi:hypothetical protein
MCTKIDANNFYVYIKATTFIYNKIHWWFSDVQKLFSSSICFRASTVQLRLVFYWGAYSLYWTLLRRFNLWYVSIMCDFIFISRAFWTSRVSSFCFFTSLLRSLFLYCSSKWIVLNSLKYVYMNKMHCNDNAHALPSTLIKLLVLLNKIWHSCHI